MYFCELHNGKTCVVPGNCLPQRMWQQRNAGAGVIHSAGGRECGGISSTPQIALLSWKAQAQQGMCSILQGASVLQFRIISDF